MKLFSQRAFLPFRRFRWRLTLSYNLVTLAALFLLAWWGLVVATIYLQRANPSQTLLEVVNSRLLPALGEILPSALILVIPAVLVSAYFGYLTARWLDIRLGNLRRAVQAWQAGDFSVTVQDDVADEIGAFGQGLNGMAGEMERLLRARGDLAALEERNHLARDLHDSVKQQITAASFQLAAAGALFERDPQAARASLVEAEKLTQAAGKELNAIIFELRPVALKPGGLEQSLRDYIEGWRRQNPVEVRLMCEGQAPADPHVQQELVRFAQEALSNVARHSGASLVEVLLSSSPQEVALSVRDDGSGFEPEPQGEAGFGLRSMRERIEGAGGRFTLESSPGQGTRLTARIPLDKETHGKTN
jgi:NarL family two-component system sensor histidine kinase LiaS